MRRRILFLLLMVGLLLPLSPTRASAQVSDGVNLVEAVIQGRTIPGVGTPLSPNGRTAGPGEFRDNQIVASITCTSGGVTATAVATVAQPAGATVDFDGDDDLSDGSGTVDPTSVAPDESFSGTGVGAIAGGVPTAADVNVALVADGVNAHSGTFHRVGGIVRVHIKVEARLTIGAFICHGDARLRIEFSILPFVNGGDDIEPLSGFLLVGVARGGNANPDVDPLGEGREPCSSLESHLDTVDTVLNTVPPNDWDVCGEHGPPS